MGKYSEFISLKRRSVDTPDDLVKNGKAVFGTFKSEFKTMDLVSTTKPTKYPQSMNKARLTLWEATEIHLKEGLLLVAVSDMSLMGVTKVVFFDYRSRKVYTWDNMLKSKDTLIAKNLMDGNKSYAKTKNSEITFINNFELGRAHVFGYSKTDKDIIEFDYEFEKMSDPSVVSIPFGENRPLYTEKMFFKAEGYTEFNGERLNSDIFTTSIIDDHRGFYPRRAHYDWLCAQGMLNDQYIAFNLTRNQSINQNDYNENLIWFKDRISLLPPVTFEKDIKIKNLKKEGKQIVHIKDEHGMVDLTYTIEATSAMVTHAVIVNIDYYVTFGKINGYLLDEDGNKYEFNDYEAIGEDKTLLF